MPAGAWRLADDNGLDEVPYDRRQPLFDRFVGVVASEEDQLADPNLDVCRVKLRLQLLDLPLKILCRLFDCRQVSGEQTSLAAILSAWSSFSPHIAV
ncbi:hypothetical protein ACFOHY_10270 [Rhizobium rosettiformans]|uniref:hypothetical protein n=1 Tax=Rhizobium rosettiformans TaxID=1368430 RepID=UPI00362199D9